MDNESKEEVIANSSDSNPTSSISNVEEVDSSTSSENYDNSSGTINSYDGRGGVGNTFARGMDRLASGTNNLSNRLKNGGNKLNNYSNNHNGSKSGNIAGSMGDKLSSAGNKLGNLGGKLGKINKGVQAVNNAKNVANDPSVAGELAKQKAKQVAVEGTKKAAKVAVKSLAKFLLPFLPYILLALLIILAIFIGVSLLLGLFDGNGFSSNNGITYQSDCNYENTIVTVMDGDNTTVIDTISLEDYILGVLCPEIGACGGQVANKEEHYIKTKIIAAKTYVLARDNYKSSSKSIRVRASTKDQQWCDLEVGCIVTKTDDLIPGYDNQYYMNTYPINYTGTIDGFETDRYTYTEQDLELLHQYYEETFGELYLSDNYTDVITSLGNADLTEYKGNTQNFWKNQAISGKNYIEILDSTGASGVTDSEDYVGKSIYKLGDYCKVISPINTSLDFVNWMIEFAADDNHGYSMDNRLMNPDVDCSSFVYYALINNGYTNAQLGSYPFSTASMDEILTSVGFEQIPYDKTILQEGDILWYPVGFNNHKYGHTEVYVGDGKTVGAHSNKDGFKGDSSGKEVSVTEINRVYKSIFRKKIV